MEVVHVDDFKVLAEANGLEMIIKKYAEETNELLSALHAEDVPNIKEEIADVLIMVEQVMVHFNISEEDVYEVMLYKIKRTKERLGIKDEL